MRIMEEDVYQRVEKLLFGKVAEGGPDEAQESVPRSTKAYLDEVPREKWFEIRLKNDEANEQLEKAGRAAQRACVNDFDAHFEEKNATRSPPVTIWRRAC